jgi:acyl dehydratase
MEIIRFDDVEKLRSKVSQEFSAWSEPIEVTQHKINQFADVTGDYYWIHIDIERAKRESPFKGPIAHGFLTLSLLPAFEIPRDWNVASFRSFVNYGGNKLRFISPVPAGANVHARSRSRRSCRERKSQPRPRSKSWDRTSPRSSTREFFLYVK